MQRHLLILLAFLVTIAPLWAQQTCPRIWRAGDTLYTDPAPAIQWLRNGQPIPGATSDRLPVREPGTYTVRATGQPSLPYPFKVKGHTVAGYIADGLGRPLPGATVAFGSRRAVSDETGRFLLDIGTRPANPETPIVLTVSKEGYWSQHIRQYLHAQATTETRFQLRERRVTNRVDATQGGRLLYQGFGLELPPDAVQTEDGRPYSGTILLSVEGARPTDPDFGLRMPGGDFSAIDENGNDVMLYSYGFITVEMTSESGQRLELRPEARATLRFSLPHTETFRPERVPLWHFDEATALWRQEGWSVRNGSIYEGEVSHFSTWNCDWPAERGTVKGRLTDCLERAVGGGWVQVGQRQVFTDSLGQYWSFVPGGITFDTWSSTDTLRTLNVAAQEERTLDDLRGGAAFGGSAFWNAQTQQLDVYEWGRVPSGLRLSVDGGQTWTTERSFTGLTAPPDRVMVEDSCQAWFRVWVQAQQADCRQLSLTQLDQVRLFRSTEEAFASGDVVYRLNLSDGQLRADQASALAAFSCLQWLNLGWNQLTQVPETIGNLTQLVNLNLRNNRLTDLPASIGNLTQLQRFDLSLNQLTQVPETIGNLAQLQTLFLDSNELTELPASIGNLTQLQELDIYANKLMALPESIGNLTQLQQLYLPGNQLTDLPASIGNLTQLRVLYLSGNQLIALPESIGNLTQLQALYLDGNQLTDLPETIGNLTQLERLELGTNQLTDLPETIGNLTQLQGLSLSKNQLMQVPESIGNLTQLQWLELSGNQLTEFPEAIGNLTQLRWLDLHTSQLTNLPASIGNLTQLQELYLNNNRLTDLPASIGNLTQLRVLDLHGNPIPVERRAAIQALLPNTQIYW
jgi:leucine-rich repeat protein SHOC2